jgi:AP endonuclease-1
MRRKVPVLNFVYQTMDLKKKWNEALRKHLRSLQETKPVIWAGDFNCIMSKKGLVETF